MEKEFVNYEQAVALKELGFNEKCFTDIEHKKVCEEQSKPNGCQLHNLHCGYPDCTIDRTKPPVGMPLKQQVFRWFREQYGINHNITRLKDKWEWSTEGNEHYFGYTETYEESENACIDKLIELAKQQDEKDINQG